MKKQPDTIDYFSIGGKIKVNTFKKVLQNGYKNDTSNIDGYEIDKSLSGKRSQVYHNKEKNHTIINHRGTQGIHDLYTDVQLMFNNTNNKRFDHGKKITDEAIKKYNNSDITVTGHSLGHAIAQEANKKHDKELVTLNGAITPNDLIRRQKDNEFVVRSNYDPVSMLHNLRPMKNNDNTVNIKAKSWNPLTEHKTDVLDRLDQDEYIGK